LHQGEIKIRIIIHRAFNKWRNGECNRSQARPRSRQSFSEFAPENSTDLKICFSSGLGLRQGPHDLERLACREELDRNLGNHRPKPALTFLHSGFFRYLMPKQDKCFVTAFANGV
jgi:hypothetical protein